MNTQNTASQPAADATSTATSSARADQMAAAVEMLAGVLIAEGGARPMPTVGELLMKGVAEGWSALQVAQVYAIAHDIDQAIARQQPTAPAAVPHIWHEVNGAEMELAADGGLMIRAGGRKLELDSREALGLLMFFRFPGVAAMIEAADAANQARREAATLAELERSRQRDAEIAAERAEAVKAAAAADYAEGVRLGLAARGE